MDDDYNQRFILNSLISERAIPDIRFDVIDLR